MVSRKVVAYSILPSICFSFNVNAAPSFTGATGSVSTPTANIAPEAEFHYQYNNFGEAHFADRYDKTRNHLINLGISDSIEISGRLTDYVPEGEVINLNGTKKGKRDLSGNLKIKLPKLSDSLPDFAIGVNDIAGEAVNFRSQYIVGSKKLGKSLVSIGYATGENPSFHGRFASIQYSVNPFLELDVEYDTQDAWVGGRYDMGHLGVPMSLQVSTPLSNDKRDTVIGINVYKNLSSPQFLTKKKASNSSIPVSSTRSVSRFLEKLAQSYQLESIQQGRTQKGTLVIAVEHSIYNHNIMDIFSIVYGTAHELLPDIEKELVVVLKDNGISKIATKAAMPALRKFFSSQTYDASVLAGQWKVWYPANNWFSKLSGVQNVKSAPSTRLDVKVQPNLRTAVGTEWGTFDYSTALRATTDVNLWKGGKLSGTWDAPLSKTPLYDEGHIYDELAHKSGLTELALHQEIKPSAQTLGLVSIGKAKINEQNYKLAQLEGGWRNSDGRHHLSGKLAGYQDDQGDNRTIALLKYQHNLHHKDLKGAITYGKFFEQEKGLRAELGKDFGRTQVDAYVKYVDNDDISGGLQVTLPLTARRDYKRGHVVMRGNEHWTYAQETTIKDPIVVGSNRIRYNMMLNPTLQYDYHAQGNIKGDLSPSYIQSNLHNLKESYLSFR